MIGIGLDGVGTSSHSTFFIINSRNARAVKIINQHKSKTRSVQARIVCVGEKLVVVTFMDTSPFIQSFKNKNQWFVITILRRSVKRIITL
jgi:hypothetical protein